MFCCKVLALIAEFLSPLVFASNAPDPKATLLVTEFVPLPTVCPFMVASVVNVGVILEPAIAALAFISALTIAPSAILAEVTALFAMAAVSTALSANSLDVTALAPMSAAITVSAAICADVIELFAILADVTASSAILAVVT